MPVVSVLAPKVRDSLGQVSVLSGITDMPEEVVAYIQGRVPTFKLKFSKTVGQEYYASTCPKCGMLSGDFHLHSEPGAPFFPTTEEEAASLYMTEIPISAAIDDPALAITIIAVITGPISRISERATAAPSNPSEPNCTRV